MAYDVCRSPSRSLAVRAAAHRASRLRWTYTVLNIIVKVRPCAGITTVSTIYVIVASRKVRSYRCAVAPPRDAARHRDTAAAAIIDVRAKFAYARDAFASLYIFIVHAAERNSAKRNF